MKKSYLLQEYPRNFASGLSNTVGLKTYFGSQLIEIEDILRIDDSVYEWTQNEDGSQLINLNNTRLPITRLDSAQLKGQYQRIELVEDSTYPSWNLILDTQSILLEYIRSQLKTYRTFENIKTSQTIYKNLDLYIYEYINNNILDRYTLDRVLLFVEYLDFDSTLLPLKPIWDNSITFNNGIRLSDNELARILVTNYSLSGNTIVNFRQKFTKNSKGFKYHYDLVFKKI